MASAKPTAKKPAGKGKPGRKPKQEGEETVTDMDRAVRNAEIVSARMRGLSYDQLEVTYHLSRRRLEQIVSEYRAVNPTLRNQDPIDVADELIEGYKADIEELVIIGATTNQDQVRVGAINSRMAARQRIAELLQALGVLPKDLGQLHIAIDVRQVAVKVVAVLKEHEVGEEVQDALLAALEPAGGAARQIEAA